MLRKPVVIIGGGPSGSALAILLVNAGIKTILFDSGKRPPLIVGESFIPAVVPLLRELGVEDEVRSYSMLKPGASFYHRPGEDTTIVFSKHQGSLPWSPKVGYAYNVPRDLFDATLLKKARSVGAEIISDQASVELHHGRPVLSSESLSLAGLRSVEDVSLLVDASGRSRLLSRLLNLPADLGERNDAALFAHLDTTQLDYPGNIHINRLQHGWSWRIPLPGKVSVGVVIGADYLKEYGATSTEQYDAICAREEILAPLVRGAKRLTDVAKYSNYQLVSQRMSGPGWVLVGDAAGFVDPIFSSGIYLSLFGASSLAATIRTKGIDPSSLALYERTQQRQIRGWQHLAMSFYNGRLFGLTRAGKFAREFFPWSLIVPHCERQLNRALTGMSPPGSISFGAARMMLNTRLGAQHGERLQIR